MFFRESLAVIQLDAGTAPTFTALDRANKTTLTASLTQATPGGELTFSLSDLTNRLMLLQQTITPDSYTALRVAQSLRPEFPDFPAKLSALLRQPAADASFVAVLALSGTPEVAHTFEIVQLSTLRPVPLVTLNPSSAAPDVLLSTLAAQARADAAAAEQAQSAASSAASDLRTTQAALATLRTEHAALNAELPALRAGAAATAAARDDAATAQAALSSLRDEQAAASATSRDEVAALRRDLTAAVRARADADGLAAALRARADAAEAAERARDRAVGEAARLAGELTKANATVARLRDELLASRDAGRGARERARVRDALVERQESAIAEANRERRRLADAARLAEVERDGLAKRLAQSEARIEETTVVLAANDEYIRFLNKELNHRDSLLAAAGPAFRGGSDSDASSRTGSVGTPAGGDTRAPPRRERRSGGGGAAAAGASAAVS